MCVFSKTHAIDFLHSGTHLFAMSRFLVALLAVVMLAVVSFTTSARDADGGVMSDPAAHAHHKDVKAAPTASSCDPDDACDAEAAMCDSVCGGFAAAMPTDRSGSKVLNAQAKYVFADQPAITAYAPGLNERPPNARLL